MRAGLLRDRGTLQKPADETQDDFGQPADDWEDVAEIWFQLLYLNGKETIAAGHENATTAASVRMRRRPVSANMRILHGDKILSIKAVLPGPRNEYIDLAVEVADAPASP